jgi:hypothetical protein
MSLQCQCLTAKKTQCSRNASQGSKYCFQNQSCSNVFATKSVSAPKPVSAIVSPMKAEDFYAQQYQYQQEEKAKINAIEPTKSVSAPKPVSVPKPVSEPKVMVSLMKAEDFYAQQYQYQQEEKAKINATKQILDDFKNSDYQKLILEDGDFKVVFTKDILTKDNKFVSGECFLNGKKIKCKVRSGVYRVGDILDFVVELLEDGGSHRME